MRISLKKLCAILAFSGLLPLALQAQEKPSKGIDERINEAFQPVTDATNNIVFYSIKVGDSSIPLIVVLLALGACFLHWFSALLISGFLVWLSR